MNFKSFKTFSKHAAVVQEKTGGKKNKNRKTPNKQLKKRSRGKQTKETIKVLQTFKANIKAT